MNFFKSNADRVPDHIRAMAEQTKAGKMDRREFLTLASVFGASTAMAYSMMGLAAPTKALAQEPQKGGVLKVAMWIKIRRTPHRRLVGNRQCSAPDARAKVKYTTTTRSSPTC